MSKGSDPRCSNGTPARIRGNRASRTEFACTLRNSRPHTGQPLSPARFRCERLELPPAHGATRCASRSPVKYHGTSARTRATPWHRISLVRRSPVEVAVGFHRLRRYAGDANVASHRRAGSLRTLPPYGGSSRRLPAWARLQLWESALAVHSGMAVPATPSELPRATAERRDTPPVSDSTGGCAISRLRQHRRCPDNRRTDTGPPLGYRGLPGANVCCVPRNRGQGRFDCSTYEGLAIDECLPCGIDFAVWISGRSARRLATSG